MQPNGEQTPRCHAGQRLLPHPGDKINDKINKAAVQHTVAGVSAVTPAAASACLNAPDATAGLLRAKAKRDWFPRESRVLARSRRDCPEIGGMGSEAI